MIREEFEKAFDAFNEPFKSKPMSEWPDDVAIALWAAKWMAERCAKIADETIESRADMGHGDFFTIYGEESAKEIRQLAKELDQEGSR